MTRPLIVAVFTVCCAHAGLAHNRQSAAMAQTMPKNRDMRRQLVTPMVANRCGLLPHPPRGFGGQAAHSSAFLIVS
jgi:hypothetical protein